jgi:hypothetical protein
MVELHEGSAVELVIVEHAIPDLGIYLDTSLLKSDGTLIGGNPVASSEILAVGSKTMVRVQFTYKPKEVERSSKIRFCMLQLLKGVDFYCNEFSFRKVWKPKPE